MKQHIILGTDRRQAEAERDKWLAENPGIRIVRLHPPEREAMSWLSLMGGRDVPRFSIRVEYEEMGGLSTAT
jgi:hypothetical protein